VYLPEGEEEEPEEREVRTVDLGRRPVESRSMELCGEETCQQASTKI
jgi:hypothetical protein